MFPPESLKNSPHLWEKAEGLWREAREKKRHALREALAALDAPSEKEANNGYRKS